MNNEGRNQVIDECIQALRALPEGTWGDESGERSPWPLAIEAVESLKQEKKEEFVRRVCTYAGCNFAKVGWHSHDS
jgi:hypothetical protein